MDGYQTQHEPGAEAERLVDHELHTDQVTKLENILQKFSLGKYGGAVATDILHDLAEYKQSRYQIGKSGNWMHDAWLGLRYALKISTPEQELRSTDKEMHDLDLFYHTIEAKLWKLSDSLQQEHERHLADLDDILEGRTFAQAEINRIGTELIDIARYIAALSHGKTSSGQQPGTGPSAQRYGSLSPAELRSEAYRLKKMEAQRKADKKNLNITARRIHAVVQSYEQAREELQSVINRVIKHKYDGVERYLQESSPVTVDLSETVESLTSVQDRLKTAQSKYQKDYATAATTQEMVWDMLSKLSSPSKPARPVSHESANRSRQDLEAEFDSLDAEVDALQEKMNQPFH